MSEAVFAWPISSQHGWGVRGLGYALNWLGTAVSCSDQLDAELPPDDQRWGLLRQRMEQSRAIVRAYDWSRERCDGPVLVPLGNDLTARTLARGNPTIACPVFEDVERVEKEFWRLKEYDAVVCASRWNVDILASLGVDAVLCHEGIDPVIFHPGVRRNRSDGRFRVFSGGKAEWRKGQDIVISAFKVFVEKHDDAVLVAAWGSPFGVLARDFEGKCAFGAPPGWHLGVPNFHAWTQRAGIRPQQFEYVPPRPNWQMAEVYGGVDVALFPNRREGGTNFPLMEAMACGVPTISRGATGHLDLPCGQIEDGGVDGYVDALERVYEIRDIEFRMPPYWTWGRHCNEMIDIISNL